MRVAAMTTSKALLKTSADMQNTINQRLNGLDWLSYYLSFKEILESFVNDKSSKEVIDRLPNKTLDLIGQIVDRTPNQNENVIVQSMHMQLIAVDVENVVNKLKRSE